MTLKELILDQNHPAGPIFDPEAFKDEVARQELEGKINAPFVRVRISTLGGKDRATLMLTISLDPREEWANGIFENSRYMRFHLGQNRVLEQFVLSVPNKRPTKFRKTRVKSLDELAIKINQYIKNTEWNNAKELPPVF